ncbi:MAG TPA: oligosaccharide flippase family protein, partial [Pyrinomonadaceae bacterium]
MSETPLANKQRSSSNEPERHFSTEHLKDDLGRRSARAGAVTVGSQLFKFALGTASTIVLARLLTPQDYGLIGMVAILVNFVVMFQYMGLSTATIQWPELNHQQVSTLFWINMALSTAIMLLMAAISPA